MNDNHDDGKDGDDTPPYICEPSRNAVARFCCSPLHIIADLTKLFLRTTIEIKIASERPDKRQTRDTPWSIDGVIRLDYQVKYNSTILY